MAGSTQSALLERLDEALRHGKATAVSHVFQEAIGVAADLDDLGREIGNLLLSLYDDFHIGSFVSFVSWLKNHPAEEVTEPALAAVAGATAAMGKWRKMLADIAGERLARDLREQVRMRNLGAATATAERILERGTNDKERIQMAWHLGSVLGTLDHDRERAQQVIHSLERALGSKADPALLQGIRQSYQSSQSNLTMADMSQREMQYNMLHTQTVAELMRALPGLMMAGEPSGEELERAYRALHGLVAGYFSDPARFAFLDVARILREFCPADPRETGPVEGVEDAAFQRMNAAQKIGAVRALRHLGEKEKLADSVLEAMGKNPSGKPARILLQLMGGLSNARFAPHLIAALRGEKQESAITGVLIDALGRIGDARSLAFLQGLQADLSRARVIDPPARRRIGHCLAALGRISRNPATPNELRGEIVLQALKTLPDDRPLQRAAVTALCRYDPDGLPEAARRVAIRFIVGGLWTMDERHRAAKGDENQRTELGFREELVNVLVAIGPDALPILIQEVERHVMSYSGAFMAIGEALAKIGDERAAPLIRKMVTNALLTDESKIPEQMRETYYDSTQDRNRPLTRDKVVYSLLYAAHRTCGEAGKELLRDVGAKIQKGEFLAIGAETEAFLREILIRERLARESSGAGAAGPAAQGEKPLDAGEMAAGAFAGRPREKVSIKRLVKDIQGKGFPWVRISRRIGAFQEAAARNSQEAIPALIDQIVSRNTVLRSAAEAALLSILRAYESHDLYGVILYDILEMLRKASDARARAIVALLGRLQPEREPMKPLLVRFVQTESDAKLRARVAEIFRVASVREIATMETYHTPITPSAPARTQEKPPRVEVEREGEGAGEETPGEATSDEEEPQQPKAPPAVLRFSETQKLAIRQQYFSERRAWIDGGKKGPEPKRPAGI